MSDQAVVESPPVRGNKHLQRASITGVIWISRWLAIVTITLMVAASGALETHQPYPLVLGFLPLLIPITVNVVEWRFGARLYAARRRTWEIVQVTADGVTTLLITAFFVFDPRIPGWMLPALAVMHAGVRFRLLGGVASWLAVSVVTVLIAGAGDSAFGIALSVPELLTRLGFMLVVGVVVGMLSEGMAFRDRQMDALNSVSTVTQRMTSMDASELVDQLGIACRKVGYTTVEVFTVSGEPAYWAIAQGRDPASIADEDPADIHAWCTDLAERIGARSRPLYMRPQDALASYRHLDWEQTQVLVAPIRTGQDLFGFMVVTHPDPVPGYRKKTLMLLASHAGAALANGRRYAERRRYEKRLGHQATHDALTGLPNRVLFNQRLTAALRRTKGTAVHTAVLLLDLDRFKEINDTLGHDYGDALLMQVSERLSAMMRTGDIAARLGGDEFAVLVAGLADLDDAIAMANRVLNGVHQPFLVDGVTLDVEVSIGVAVCPEHGETVEDLMRCADVAMYNAKRNSLGVAPYNAQEDVHTPKRLALLGDMRRALDVRDQLLLYYQPAVDTRTGAIVGVEALLRWDHPEHGLVGPADFVPGAEGTGLIGALSRYVLEVAMDQARDWADRGYPIPIAVNMSTRVLMDLTLPDQVAAVLAARNLPPRVLRVEITESSIMEDPERALTVLRRLDALGVRMSIDDFGTGYSSMTYLKHLPVDELKIDQSFVFGMTSQNKDALLVRSLVELGHNLGMRVLAEGVENRETLQALRDLGCDIAQGFYIAQPMSAVTFDSWILSNAGRSAADSAGPAAS